MSEVLVESVRLVGDVAQILPARWGRCYATVVVHGGAGGLLGYGAAGRGGGGHIGGGCGSAGNSASIKG